MEQKYCNIEDQKPGLGWPVTRILLKGKDLNQKLKSFRKMSKQGDEVSELVQLKCTTNGRVAAKPLHAVGYGGLQPQLQGNFL